VDAVFGAASGRLERHAGVSAREGRVARLHEDLQRTQVLDFRRIREVASRCPDDPLLRLHLPALQFLLFGKVSPLPPEQDWLEPLSETELDELRHSGLFVRSSPAAFYPEMAGGWNIMNRVVDRCLVALDPRHFEPMWSGLIAESTTRRGEHLRIVGRFVHHLANSLAGDTVSAVAVRGRSAGLERIAGQDIDLLVFVTEESAYDGVLGAALSFAHQDFSALRSVSFLCVKSDEPDSRSRVYSAAESSGPHLDVFATVGDLELFRALRGDPVELRWNLEILRSSHPVLNRSWFEEFVISYETAVGLRAKNPPMPAVQPCDRFIAITHRSEIEHAVNRGLRALTRRAPRMEMWDNAGTYRTLLSPFVAALIIEAAVDPASSEVDGVQPAVRYLLETMEVGAIWRFAPDSTPEWPPDVDDTVCVLAALALVGRDDLSADVLGMIHNQADRTGLLRTWMIDEGTPSAGANDADSVVTANAAFLLHRLGCGGEPTTAQLEAAIVADLSERNVLAPSSLYHDRPAVCAYFLARWASRSGHREAGGVLTRIAHELTRMDMQGLGPAELAAFACAAVWAGAEDIAKKTLPTLVAFQHSTGLWPVSPLLTDPEGSSYGSAEVSTALAVHAMRLWLSTCELQTVPLVVDPGRTP